MSNGIERNSGAQLRNWLLGMLGAGIVLLLCACNGGGPAASAGDGGGGISGTGARTTVTGKVTGFGSVVIGGVHYTARQGATVQVEGQSAATEADLQPGMVVVLKGDFDSANSTGAYDSIEYRTDLEGPAAGVDPVAGSFTLLGQTVAVDAATIFDGVADMTAMANGALVQVSGAFDQLGRFRASRIFREKATAAPTDPVKLKGRVTTVGANSFTIGGHQVSYTLGQTIFVNLSSTDLNTAETRLIEVTGTLSGSTITANRIERRDALAGAVTGERIDITGFIQSGDASSFVLSSPNGPITVTGTGAAIKNGLPAAIQPGQRAEVTGTLKDGVLLAAAIELERDNTVKLEGDVAAVDLTGKSITLNGISVAISAKTAFKDSSALRVHDFDFSHIAKGDHLQIGGYLDTTVTPARFTATKVERFNAATSAFIQGPLSQLSPQPVILGVPIVTSVETSFKSGGIILADLAAFSAQVALNSTIVKAKGSFAPAAGQLLAIELEIQQ
jgi:uncharacterized protein DUF5666